MSATASGDSAPADIKRSYNKLVQRRTESNDHIPPRLMQQVRVRLQRLVKRMAVSAEELWPAFPDNERKTARM
jgi:hypothetical protein